MSYRRLRRHDASHNGATIRRVWLPRLVACSLAIPVTRTSTSAWQADLHPVRAAIRSAEQVIPGVDPSVRWIDEVERSSLPARRREASSEHVPVLAPVACAYHSPGSRPGHPIRRANEVDQGREVGWHWAWKGPTRSTIRRRVDIALPGRIPAQLENPLANVEELHPHDVCVARVKVWRRRDCLQVPRSPSIQRSERGQGKSRI